MRRFLLDLLFPKVSLGGKEGAWVTEEEWVQLGAQPVRLEACVLRERGLTALDGLVAADTYDASPLLRTAIRRFKYRRVQALLPILGRMLLEASALLRTGEGSCLCPVPLHWTRRCKRGFNQAELLAGYVALHSAFPLRLLLSRVRATGSQVLRTHEERTGAMRGAFALASTVSLPPHVLLVDDVCTTGATLDACARVLKDAGVRRVEGLVLALG